MAESAGDRVLRELRSPWKLRLYFLAKLPLALFAGLRLKYLDEDRCEVSVPYGWRSTNPFGSIYFAALAMAAELSTGALAMLAVRRSDKPVSMLVTGMDASFEKKASQRAIFRCEGGGDLAAAVREAIETGEGVERSVETVGYLPDGTITARFRFTWSFKAKSAKRRTSKVEAS